MFIADVRDYPDQTSVYIRYFQKYWASPDSMMVYDDCIRHAARTDQKLPHWYLLMDSDVFSEERIIGCAGMIPNDFISRCDLYPWLCALLIEPDSRGQITGAS